MAATPFRPVTWNPNEVLDEDTMDQMTNNIQWLFENSVRGSYRAGGVRTNLGIKIAAGKALIAASRQPQGSREVTFGNFFSSECNPVVTTGIISSHQRRFFAPTLHGLGGQLHPDHRGFRVHLVFDPVNKRGSRISRNLYIGWQALGY